MCIIVFDVHIQYSVLSGQCTAFEACAKPAQNTPFVYQIGNLFSGSIVSFFVH